MSIFIRRDGSVEAWDGDNYVAMGSMRVTHDSHPTQETFPPPPRLYLVIEEYPAFTIDELVKLARDQRNQRRRKARLRQLLRKAADRAARGTGVDS